MVWMSEKQSQQIDGIVYCNSDIKSGESVLSTGARRMYCTVMVPISISSEQGKTLGPRVPSKLLPDTTQDDLTLSERATPVFILVYPDGVPRASRWRSTAVVCQFGSA